MSVRDEAVQSVREYYEGQMPPHIQNLKHQLIADLYDGIGAISYVAGLHELEAWAEDYLDEAWYDIQCGEVRRAAPQEYYTYMDEYGDVVEEGEDLNDFYYLNRNEVARLLFGELITSGGMCV